ncbi:helix-turn-helix transcriptional regulator [Micromonospora sp. NPDC004551]|uniref:helix-turn-helix domain-containing protein n=1 Tax=Micromonospora sp. NPDC004551 TaxID=3154284 RepID=UPI0033ABF18C
MTTTPVGTAKPTLSEQVAREIRAEMGRQRMSAAKLARELGVSEAWTSRRLSGDQTIDLHDLERIADVLGVTVIELFPADKVRPNNR